ncbi:MAG TPA: class I SAM-dependent methyltransferase [Acidothermaceae bacterium]|nr:class I SAM-dependent methyltransferase [Acidothermaceae bacterium]
MANGAPGGIAREAAKWAAEQLLWNRVAVQHALDVRAKRTRPKPSIVAATNVLSTREDWAAACRQLRELKLPLNHDKPKNWDALAALTFVLDNVDPSGAVLDAGCARYSTLLPSLRLYGFTDLFGNNLEWSRESHHGPVRLMPGDMTATTFPDARFDAITCLSVIEHGVPIKAFLVEAARLLRPGGVLFVSTDYDQDPPDTTGKTAYGQPVHIFSPDEIRTIVKQADDAGLRLIGDLRLDHAERPVHWERVGIDYTFITLGFTKGS